MRKNIIPTKYDVKDVLKRALDVCDYHENINKATLTWLLNGGNLPNGQDIISYCAEVCYIDVNDICGCLTGFEVYTIVRDYLRSNAFEIAYVEALDKLVAFWNIEDGYETEEEFVGFTYGCDLEDRKLLDKKIEEFLDKKMTELAYGE